jgi:RNA ligase (TIGR02306 family)
LLCLGNPTGALSETLVKSQGFLFHQGAVMSEFHIQVVQLGPVTPHENADTLSITHVHGGYPCIIRTGELKEGDTAVYIPVDALLPVSNPRFAFLEKQAKNGWARIKALRLRGVFSMGLLIPADSEWVVGQDVRALLGVEKWEPPEPADMDDDEVDPGILPAYDIEGLRRWPELLTEGEEVFLTEKVHGANGRAVWYEDRLYIGSRTRFKKTDRNHVWAIAARQNQLADKLKDCPYALYFEVYGAVQDLRYGMGNGMVRLAVFDVLDWKSRRWLDVDEAKEVVSELGLPVVPPLYRGLWSMELCGLAEGQSTLEGASNVREGFVVKPVVERFDDRIGRVILKLHGEGYLTRKGS